MAHCLHKTYVPALLNEGPSSVVDLQQDSLSEGAQGLVESDGFCEAVVTTAAGDLCGGGEAVLS